MFLPLLHNLESHHRYCWAHSVLFRRHVTFCHQVIHCKQKTWNQSHYRGRVWHRNMCHREDYLCKTEYWHLRRLTKSILCSWWLAFPNFDIRVILSRQVSCDLLRSPLMLRKMWRDRTYDDSMLFSMFLNPLRFDACASLWTDQLSRTSWKQDISDKWFREEVN